MPDGSRIPTTIPAFNSYINDTDDRQKATTPAPPTKYFQDYTWTLTESGEWTTQRTFWRDTLYPKYTNPLTSTGVVKDEVKNFMKDFHTFGNPLLDKVEACGKAGPQEEHVFHLVLGRHNPTHPTTAITQDCIAGLHSMGRGDYEITCKSQTDQSRASIVPHANGVQYAFLISDEVPNPLPTPDGGTMTKELSTRALFKVSFGTQNQGKWLSICFRWYNTHYPQFAGPWSAVQTMAIG